jgi:hypothetical protein
MAPGDDVVFAETATGRFTYYGQVTDKTTNRALGERLWPFVPGDPWELIYFLRNISRISVSKASLVTELGYQSNYEVPGINRVPEKNLAAFVSKHGPLVSWLGISAATDDLPRRAGGTGLAGSEVTAEIRRRVGQEIFSGQVKANYGWKCAMCGIDNLDFLVAGHINSWAEDEANRMNPANGICLCVLHDRAFERGYFTLEDDLRVVVSPRLPAESPLRRLLSVEHMRQPASAPPAREFLLRHREEVFLGRDEYDPPPSSAGR